jgi:hypothetical protein
VPAHRPAQRAANGRVSDPSPEHAAAGPFGVDDRDQFEVGVTQWNDSIRSPLVRVRAAVDRDQTVAPFEPLTELRRSATGTSTWSNSTRKSNQ